MTGPSSPGGDPGLAEPFEHAGGPTGVLLCHGFTGSPAALRPWANHLADRGYTVRLPLLPGHGTRWQDANRTTFDDWFSEVTRSLEALNKVCGTVFVGGLSMGGTLALRLAELRPDSVAGLILVNPSVTSLRRELLLLPVLKRLFGSFPGISNDIAKPGVSEQAYQRTPLRAVDSLRRAWTLVRSDLTKVTAPLVLFRSRTDHVVEPINADIILRGVSSVQTQEVVLERSYHVATLDFDAELIFSVADGFIAQVGRDRGMAS